MPRIRRRSRAEARHLPGRVTFLFDENLSPQLAGLLAEVYPGSRHVRDVGLARSDDSAVWEFAIAHEHAIVSKDTDFHQLSFLYGPPPKVVWIRLGNCSTSQVAELLRAREAEVRTFLADPAAAFLALS